MSASLAAERSIIRRIYADLEVDPPDELTELWRRIDGLTAVADAPAAALEALALTAEETGDVELGDIKSAAEAHVTAGAVRTAAARVVLALDGRAERVHDADWPRVVTEVRPRWHDAAAVVHGLAPEFAGSRSAGPGSGRKWAEDDLRRWADLSEAVTALNGIVLGFRSWDRNVAKAGLPFVEPASDDDHGALKDRFTGFDRSPAFWISLLEDFPSARLRLAADPRGVVAAARDRRRARQAQRVQRAVDAVDGAETQAIASDPGGASRKLAAAKKSARKKVAAS